MLIHDKFYCEGYDNYDRFHDITKKLTDRQNVEFVLFCVKDVYHLVEEERKEVAKPCIDLVEKWLIDESSVTIEELKKAAAAAVWAICAASYAANAAWVAAAWTAHAAVRAYNVFGSKKLNEYLVIANSYLTKTNINCPNYEIEGKILYLIDELEENIIVHKDKYYANMNEIERCPEYGFNTQQELLEELLYSEDRFWAFVRNWLDQLYKEESNVNS